MVYIVFDIIICEMLLLDDMYNIFNDDINNNN